MRHEIHDGEGSPVRRCDRCGARLVSSGRCPSHDPATLPDRLQELRTWNTALPRMVLEVLRSLGAATPREIARWLGVLPNDAWRMLSILRSRHEAYQLGEGRWAPGRPALGDAIAVHSPAAAARVAAQLRARRAA